MVARSRESQRPAAASSRESHRAEPRRPVLPDPPALSRDRERRSHVRNLSDLYNQLDATSGQLGRYPPNTIWDMAQKLPGLPIENAQWLDKLPKQARTVRNWCYFHYRTYVENMIKGFEGITRSAEENRTF